MVCRPSFDAFYFFTDSPLVGDLEPFLSGLSEPDGSLFSEPFFNFDGEVAVWPTYVMNVPESVPTVGFVSLLPAKDPFEDCI